MKKNIIRHKKNTKKIILFLIVIVFMFGLLCQIPMGNQKNVIKSAMSGILKNFASNSNEEVIEKLAVSSSSDEYKSWIVKEDYDKYIVVPPGVEKVEDEFFYGITKYVQAKGIRWDGATNLKEIGKRAFSGVNGVTGDDYMDEATGNLPDTIETIGDGAFSGTYHLCDTLKLPNNKKYTEVAEEAFSECGINNVIFNDNITKIGKYAFKSNNFSSIDLPKNLTYIGYGAFNFNKLTSLKLPDTVTTIGDYAFANSQLTNITFGKNITELGPFAFAWNDTLKEITLPENISILGQGVLDCKNLEKVTIKCKNLKFSYNDGIPLTLGQNAEVPIYIYSDAKTTEQTLKDNGYTNINYIDDKKDDEDNKEQAEIDGIVYKYDKEKGTATIVEVKDEAIDEDGNLIIPETIEIEGKEFTITRIAKKAVQQEDIKAIVIPETVKEIEDEAIKDNEDLVIKAPKGSEGEKYAEKNDIDIKYTKEVEGIVYEYDENSGRADVLIIKDESKKDNIPETVIIDDKEYLVGKYADPNPDTGGGEESITIDGIEYTYELTYKTAAVKKVTEEAINNKEKILTIPSKITVNNGIQCTVQSILSGAVDIDGIKGINLSEGLVAIYENAFTKYEGSVLIPKDVLYLDINAFASRKAIIGIVAENPNYYIENSSMLYNKDKTIFYGFTCSYEYEGDYEWNFEVPETVKEIKERAFKYCSHFNNLQYVIIGSNVEKIADNAFEGIENKVTIVGYNGSYAENYATAHGIKFGSAGSIQEGVHKSTTPFVFGEDNYSFVNNSFAFSSNDIGDFKQYLSEVLYQKAEDVEKQDWRGSCAGMAVTSILFKYYYLVPKFWQDYGTKIPNIITLLWSWIEKNIVDPPVNVYPLKSPKSNKNLKWLINFYQVFQGEIQRDCFKKLDIEGEGEIEGFYNGVKKYYEENIYVSQHITQVLKCGFSWNEYDIKDGEKSLKTVGHAIVITGAPETLDDNFYKNHTEEFYNFKYRIPIYDVNYQEQRYIYITEKFDDVKMGTDIELKSYGLTADEVSDSSKKGIFSIDAYAIEPENVFSLEEVIQKNEQVKFAAFKSLRYNCGTAIKIENENNEYAEIKDGKKVEGSLDVDIEPIIGAIADTENEDKQIGEITEADVIFNDGDYYSAETQNETDELDVSMQFGDSYMTVKTKAGGKAIFENKKSVTLTNPSGQEYEMKLTLNKEFTTLPWFTIKVSGTEAKEMKLEVTEQGTLITGDNLKNFTVKGNNREEETELNLSTDKTQVLIKASEDKTKMQAYIDSDGDGTFETLVGESKVVENNQVADNKGNVNKQVEKVSAGDKIKIFIITLVISIVILVVIIIKKNK